MPSDMPLERCTPAARLILRYARCYAVYAVYGARLRYAFAAQMPQRHDAALRAFTCCLYFDHAR